MSWGQVLHNVVVVDDCPDDDTGAKALEAAAMVLRHSINLGQGTALQTGICYALSRSAGYIVTFDADGQHRSKDIRVLLDTQVKTEADVILGSCFSGHAENIPRLGHCIGSNQLMTWCLTYPLLSPIGRGKAHAFRVGPLWNP